MTNPTLERAARALAEIDGLDWDDMGKGSNPILSEFQDDYLLQARAVLMAVSDITASDLGRIAAEAANDAASGYEEYATEYMMWYAHKAVIQAILNDGEGE